MLPNVAFKSPPMTLPNLRARSAKIHQKAEDVCFLGTERVKIHGGLGKTGLQPSPEGEALVNGYIPSVTSPNISARGTRETMFCIELNL